MNINSATQLKAKKCLPCEGGVTPFSEENSKLQLEQLPNWELSSDTRWISRTWKLKNFVEAMRLTNSIADLAEQEQHHPDIHLTGYRKLEICLTTHAIGGLSENDFILAAKIDDAAQNMAP